MITTRYTSPIGTIALDFEGDFLVGLRFVEDCTMQCLSSMPSGHPSAQQVQYWLDAYFAGHRPQSTPPLHLCGTPFQLRVWQQLMQIPYGHTISYGDLSRQLGCRSAQAVGQAVGRNPVAILVPCHRVVGSDGSLTGYAYGLDRKRALLHIEREGILNNPIF